MMGDAKQPTKENNVNNYVHNTSADALKKKRRSNQFEALLRGTRQDRCDVDTIEMELLEEKNAKKIMFNSSLHSAMYDASTDIIRWNNGKRWIRKDFEPFQGEWRDSQGHIIAIKPDGVITYIQPEELGSYNAVVCGFYKISVTYANCIYTAKLLNKNILKWENGTQWTKMDSADFKSNEQNLK
ncbi:hypothetical protein RFI_21002 [Reticulomyxa filosa]|uniref:Uncharacterized protein n=1 Tax=Reticulomyxa filosa TaxID=46433 RepID=X6MSD1_RETFI|nr:hypothetical protein RFI_21002 [Reticulomyxa filosa]|eukprot:ETO16352.1 hypothetical protein RFI_21002 [Reticulomyxa filosa]